MRVLIALNDDKQRGELSKGFQTAGFVVDAVPYYDVDDIAGDIEHTETPYDLLVHNDDVPAAIYSKTPAHLYVVPNKVADIKQGFSGCALNRVNPKDTSWHYIQKAYTSLSLAYGHSAGVVKAGPYEVDLINNTAKVDGKELELTKDQFRIFRNYCLHQGEVLSKQDFINQVYSSESKSRNVDNLFKVQLNKLNKRIEGIAEEEYRINLFAWKKGYKIPGVPLLNSQNVIQFGLVKFNLYLGQISVNEKLEMLNPQQVQLLKALSSKNLKTYTALEAELSISRNTLNTQVVNLREKIFNITGENYIETVWGQGHKLHDEPVYYPSPKPRVKPVTEPVLA